MTYHRVGPDRFSPSRLLRASHSFFLCFYFFSPIRFPHPCASHPIVPPRPAVINKLFDQSNMQNPLRRPTGNARDVERQRDPNDDGGYLRKDVRGHLVAMSGEFVGTVMFLYFAFAGTQIANNLTPPGEPSLNQLLFISLSFGFSLAVTAWVFYRISGGLFNPAVRSLLAGLLVNGRPLKLTLETGYARNGHYWDFAPPPRLAPLSSAVSWGHSRGSSCFVHVPWSIGCGNAIDKRHLNCPRLVYRDVLDCRTRLHSPHASCREDEGNLYRACWDRTFIICCRACR